MQNTRIAIILALGILMLFPIMSSNPGSENADFIPVSENRFPSLHGHNTVAGIQDQAEWWNTSFIYRRYLNFTEPNIADRTEVPVHIYLTFTNGHCYRDSIRVQYYDSGSWLNLPFQTWNTTYDGNFVVSTTVSFMVNVTKDTTEMGYYIYYAKEDVGSVRYPGFYPFVYKSFTFSLLNLVSFYDENNYYVEMWDASAQTWKDPRDVDSFWNDDKMTPDNVPNGTLNRMQNVRYEPNPYSHTYWHGFYAIYSNLPLAVSVGQGDKGSNTAINDWFPAVSRTGTGTDTEFILGGVEGFEDRNEGKYWVQAQADNTEVYVWTADGSAETPGNWKFNNGSTLSQWPAILSAGEYISRRDVLYTVYLYVNSTKPVSARAGDSDCTYARDILGFYPAVDGKLSGQEFYTIDMGHSYDYTRVTNLGDTTVTVDYWRNTGSGWGSKTTLSIDANKSYDIPRGTASSSKQEDILHIKGEDGANLMVYGAYRPSTPPDAGDWVPALSGDRYGSSFKIWGHNGWKFMIVATENANVQVSGTNSGTLEIPAGGASSFRPLSSSATLYHINSNASISVVLVGSFSTSSPYNPTGDTGYGWMVPTYNNDADQNALVMVISDEIHLFEFDITVQDLDGLPVENAIVTLYYPNGTLWEDDNGLSRTGTTDSSGFIVFEGLDDDDYMIRAEIDAADWLVTSYGELWVEATPIRSITGPVTPVTVTLPMGSFAIYMEDLMGNAMSDTPDETTTLRVSNESNPAVFSAQASTNSSGWAHFYRVPQDDYDVFSAYSGNVTSYSYAQIAAFASWSIDSTEFDSGTFHHYWTLPLVTIRLQVMSWDDQQVENAYVKISNAEGPAYDLTRTTDAEGKYNFYRVVNGTWSIDVWKADDYPDTPTVRNDTVTLTDVQGEESQTILLPITRLNIEVRIAGTESVVQNAQVNITYVQGDSTVATGSTDSSGLLTFFNIHGNITGPTTVSYTVTVKSGDVTNSSVEVRVDYLWTYINVIYLSSQAYHPDYTELNSSLYFRTVYWGEDANFTVGYYDRDGTLENPSDSAIDLDSTSWLNYTIYYDTTPIGWGTWNWTGMLHVYNESDGLHFRIHINTMFWMMNVTDSAYTVVVRAHTDGYNDPTALTFYVTVRATPTTLGKSSSSIEEYYKTHDEHDFWLWTTIPTTTNLTDLDIYSFDIRQGTTSLRSGDLIDNIGYYSLHSTALHGLPVGSYTLTIILAKQNYINRTNILDVIISPVPMMIDSLAVANYDWDIGTETVTFRYLIAENSTNPELSSITVTIQWFTSGWVSVYNMTPQILSPVAGVYTATFPSNLLDADSDYHMRITCSKTNYGIAVRNSTSTVYVSRASTTLSVVGDDSITINWLQTGIFDLHFMRDSGSVGLSGASIVHDWSRPVQVSYQGEGVYRIFVDTSVESGLHSLELTFSLANHDEGIRTVNITILTPLLVETDYGSIENPLETYWTHEFHINITLYDQSRVDTVVDGADLSYRWYMESVIDEQGTLAEDAGGLYYVLLDANNALPNDLSYIDEFYTIVLTAEKAGCTTTVMTIYLVIRSTPNEVILPQQYFEQYYDDTFHVSFYWNNTLDNEPITDPESATYEILGIIGNATTGTNLGNGWYNITINTRSLGMTAAVQGTVYVLRIAMGRSGFESHEIAMAIILVRETPTGLVISDIGVVNWSDEIAVTVNLWDIHHDVLIDGSADVTLSVVGTDYSSTLSNDGSGVFTWTIDTDLWFSGSTGYTFLFTYSLPNYIDGTNATAVYINPIPAMIDKDPQQATSLSVVWGLNFTMRVIVNQDYGTLSNPINGLTVTYTWQGTTVSGVFAGIGNGGYLVTVNSSEVTAGLYTITVDSSNENYTFTAWSIQVSVEHVDTSLHASQAVFDGIYGGPAFTVRLTYNISSGMTFAGRVLEGAMVTTNFGGGLVGTWDATTNSYRFVIDASQINAEDIPGVFTVSFYASLTNYANASTTIELVISADTSLAVPNIQVQENQMLTIYLNYFDLTKNAPVPISAVTSLTITTPLATFTKDDIQVAEDGRYYITIDPSQVGPVSAQPYSFQVSIEADGYKNQIGVTSEIRVIEVHYTIPLVNIAIPQSQLFLFLSMLGVFVLLVGGGALVKRWRIPYQIKQINKAIKAMENNNKAKVEKIKNMGMIVSEILAPGLAELDLAAPVIDTAPTMSYEDMISEDAEDLLDELDALDDVQSEDTEVIDTDKENFEAELEAELDSTVESEIKDITDEDDSADLEDEKLDSEASDTESSDEAVDTESDEKTEIEDVDSEDAERDAETLDSDSLDMDSEEAAEFEESTEEIENDSEETEFDDSDESQSVSDNETSEESQSDEVDEDSD